ncbi:hypothetical protein [Kitasatospora aureofaciens]|uniref:hypothetical protein n=1 Tax=Kitasatospora aureofaciens TaxID=1894 RepID=UPI00131A92B0|nr:hypothetical protein [Kitasatospora aureofaciens]
MQSSVGESERSEVGGLRYTAQNLGSSLGTAPIGAIVISALAAAFTAAMAKDPAVSETVRQRAGIRIESWLNFVPADQAAAALAKTSIPPEEADAVVSAYRTAQLDGLKVAVLAAAGITLAGFPFTRRLPATGSGYGRVPARTRGTPPGGPGDSTEQHEELP